MLYVYVQLCSSVVPAYRFNILNTLITEIQERPSYAPHPEENAESDVTARNMFLQTHIEALHFLYLCDNIGTITSTSAIDAASGKPVKKKKLHQVTVQDKKYIIYNTGEFEEE